MENFHATLVAISNALLGLPYCEEDMDIFLFRLLRRQILDTIRLLEENRDMKIFPLRPFWFSFLRATEPMEAVEDFLHRLLHFSYGGERQYYKILETMLTCPNFTIYNLQPKPLKKEFFNISLSDPNDFPLLTTL